MKNRTKISAIASLLLCSAFGYSQNQADSLGLPGDNLDLNAVLSIFKQSSSVEDFEKRLNSADTKINNLDLNNDQKVDYLRVVDYGKDDFHSLVIQDPVSKSESQDVAVVEVQKTGNQTAHVQIVGDEALYGKNYIIEPTDGQPQASSSSNNNNNNSNNNSNNGGYNDDVYNSGNSNSADQSANSQIMINVWGWPSVGYLYNPGYSYWVSPWYWGYYPGWYSPWSPYGGWYAYHRGFYGWNYGFYGYRTNIYAFPRAHNYYYGHRMTSGYVNKTVSYGSRGGNRVYNGSNRSGSGRATSGGGRFSNNNNAGPRNSSGGSRVSDNGSRGGGGMQSNSNSGRVQQNNGGGRAQSSPNIGRSQGGNVGFGGNSGGARSSGGGGGGRMGGGGFGGGGGAHVGGGGGGRMGGGGGGGFGGGHGGGGGGRR